MKRISLVFEGYWINKNNLPKKSGIYCVYSCVTKDVKTIKIKKLLYIGESVNVHDRIANHDRLIDWNKYLNGNEILCYSFATINGEDRERAEAALIKKHQPPTNEEHMNHFIYNDTERILDGKISELNANFIMKKTN